MSKWMGVIPDRPTEDPQSIMFLSTRKGAITIFALLGLLGWILGFLPK